MASDFWTRIAAQYEALRSARTVDHVLALCPHQPGVSAGQGFFEGSGGDLTVRDALLDAGWTTVVYKAHFYWVMRAPDGGLITYTEGDLDRGDRITRLSA